MKDYLIKHIRFCGKLIGTIAVSKTEIGLSIVHPEDIGSKAEGRRLAVERLGSEQTIPNRWISATRKIGEEKVIFESKTMIVVERAIEEAKISARKYFKDETLHGG